jgi:hypothetical protein
MYHFLFFPFVIPERFSPRIQAYRALREGSPISQSLVHSTQWWQQVCKIYWCPLLPSHRRTFRFTYYKEVLSSMWAHFNHFVFNVNVSLWLYPFSDSSQGPPLTLYCFATDHYYLYLHVSFLIIMFYCKGVGQLVSVVRATQSCPGSI